MNTETGRLEYRRVVMVPEASRGDLYALAREWVVTVFRDSGAVTQLDDAERAKLIVRGVWREEVGLYRASHWFDATVETKDGRYRVTFTNVTTRTTVAGREIEYPIEQNLTATISPRARKKLASMGIDPRAEFVQKFNSAFNQLAGSLQHVMTQAKVDDDW